MQEIVGQSEPPSEQVMKILLSDWAARNYSPAPSLRLLREWVKSGQVAATLIGGAYYVNGNAKRKVPRFDHLRAGARMPKAQSQPVRGVQSAERRHQSSMRRAEKLNRIALWADQEKILVLHEEARRLTIETGIVHHVDHEIPLQGKLVSGLHVHNNLQVLTADDNRRKRNRFEIE